ncbi:MAG TPA: HAD family phosphatase [Thermomicrobiales bacterium]|nr:HAD family phosphatase [Thermomicrobiales bacterium]
MTTPTPVGLCAGVVFDLDGVLVESEHLWEESWTAEAAAAGYVWRHDDTAACQGMSVPEWSRYMADRIGGEPAAIARAVIDRMIAALAAGRIELLGGAASMVAAAAARAPIAVASSAPRRLIEAVLATTGLRAAFSAVVSSEEVARGKPSPDVYAEAARRIGRDPIRCAAVEDSSNGIRAAAAAGMLVIAIPNPVYPPRPDALALCAKIAASADDARRFLLERLPDPKPEDRLR